MFIPQRNLNGYSCMDSQIVIQKLEKNTKMTRKNRDIEMNFAQIS